MEWRTLGVTPRNYADNQILHQMNDMKAVIMVTRESKICWAGHVARLADNQ